MNHNSYNQSPDHTRSTAWDTVKNTPYDPELAERLSKTPIHRKAEIAKSILEKDESQRDPSLFLSQRDIEDVYRSAIKGQDGLASSEINFMQHIDTPLGKNSEHVQDVFSSLAKQESKILSYLSGVGFDNYQQGRAADLQSIVNRYPSPSALIPQVNQLLTALAKQETPTKVQEYVRSFNTFKQKAYGERCQYSEAFDELYSDAKNYFNTKGWAIRLNSGRPKLLFDAESTSHSQPLEKSPYHSKALDDQLAAQDHQIKAAHAAESAKLNKINEHSTKIINSLFTGKHVTEVSNSLISPSARENVYNWINNGQLTPAYESQFLQTIATPMQSKNGSLEQTLHNLTPHEQGILAFARGRGFNNQAQTNPSDLQNILSQYPTPVEFQSIEDTLLDTLRHSPNNSPEDVLQYQKDCETFKQKIYGKRQEYHAAWQNLVQEAHRQQKLAEFHQQMFNARPSSELSYQAPEVRAYYDNQSNANSTPNQAANSSPTNPTAKKGIFGKLFNRKK